MTSAKIHFSIVPEAICTPSSTLFDEPQQYSLQRKRHQRA